MPQQPYYTKIVIQSPSQRRAPCVRYISKGYSSIYGNCSAWKNPCQRKKKSPPCNVVKGPDCFVDRKKINCCFIRGKVLCEFDGCPVNNAIVIATRESDGKVFTGITNRRGEYCICVSKGDRYAIECFLCSEECFSSAPCSCGEVSTCC